MNVKISWKLNSDRIIEIYVNNQLVAKIRKSGRLYKSIRYRRLDKEVQELVDLEHEVLLLTEHCYMCY